MANATRFTLVSTNARIDALEGLMESGFTAVLARLDGVSPTTAKAAKPAAKATRKPARKAPAKKVATPKARKATTRVPSAKRGSTVPGAVCLTSGNRAEFIRAHQWALDLDAALKAKVGYGVSTQQLAQVAVQSPEAHPLSKGWAIGPKYTAKFLG